MAFGSAAPELFLNSVSAVAKTSDLSLSAVLGSGMVAFGLIPSLCVLNGLKNEMKFRSFPILREVCSLYCHLILSWRTTKPTLSCHLLVRILPVGALFVSLVYSRRQTWLHRIGDDCFRYVPSSLSE